MGFLDFCIVAIGVVSLCCIATACESISDELARMRKMMEEE